MQQPNTNPACLDQSSFWQVMQCKGKAHDLQDAMESNDVVQLQRLIGELHAAYHQQKRASESDAGLEACDDDSAGASSIDEVQLYPQTATATSTQCDLAAQERINETYVPKDVDVHDSSLGMSDTAAHPTSHVLCEGSLVLPACPAVQQATDVEKADAILVSDMCNQTNSASSTQYDLAAQEYIDDTYTRKDADIDSSAHGRSVTATQSTSSHDDVSQEGSLAWPVGPAVKKSRRAVKTGPASRSDCQSLWLVMQYEALLDKLKDAMEKKKVQEVHGLMHNVRMAYQKMKHVKQAEAILEAGRYNLAAREHISKMYHSEFCTNDANDIQQHRGPIHLPAQAAEDQMTSFPKPLNHFLHDPFASGKGKPQAVLQLRGGGMFDCGYGSCSGAARQVVFGDSRTNVKPEQQQKVEPLKPRFPLYHTVIFSINAFLDRPAVAFTLVTMDLTCDIMGSIITAWTWCTWVSDAVLLLMCTQQLLEIYLNSKWSIREILEGETVRAVVSFYADDGESRPYRVQVGTVGTVETLQEATWRNDYGAFIAFEDHKDSCFVSEHDFIDLEVTSGLADYFSKPMNDFNVFVLILCVMCAFIGGKAAKAGYFLLALRFLRPVVKIYSRMDKAQGIKEHHERLHEKEEEEEKEKAAAVEAKSHSGCCKYSV